MKKLLHFFLVLACGTSITANAQYYLDSSFARYGIDTFAGYIPTGVIHRPQFVLPTKDNKIVIAGYAYGYNTLEVMRLKNDGTFDSTFSDTGVVRASFSGAMIDPPESAILYDTSKIMMFSDYVNVGNGFDYGSVYSFNSNGTLNTAFGTNGMASVNPYLYTISRGGGVQHDGKVVVLSSTLQSTTGIYKYCLNRLMPNGTLDNTFGTAGLCIGQYPMIDSPSNFATGNQANTPRAGLMQDDDKFVVMGFFADSTSIYQGWQVFLVRHNADGSPDMTFGDGDGVAVIKDINALLGPFALVSDSAGNYYVFSKYDQISPISSVNYTVTKLDHNGHRYTNYGTNGVAYLTLNIPLSTRISVQKDGRVLIPNIFRTDTPFTDYFSVFRLDTLGNFDTSFSPTGRIYMYSDSIRHDLCVNAAVQEDGKILLIGWDSLSATSICMRITDTTQHPILSTAPVQQVSFTAGIYPNPSRDRAFTIHYINNGLPGRCTLDMYDATGKLVDTHQDFLAKGPGNIPYHLPSTTPPGIYHVVLTNEQNERQVYKVVYY